MLRMGKREEIKDYQRIGEQFTKRGKNLNKRNGTVLLFLESSIKPYMQCTTFPYVCWQKRTNKAIAAATTNTTADTFAIAATTRTSTDDAADAVAATI